MLNIDRFKPCKHTEYSVGAMYLTFMNLPCTMRFRQENVLLIGLIAGPSEPETDINPFLAPLVHELQNVFQGVEIHIIRVFLFTVHCFAWHVIYLRQERFVDFWDILLLLDVPSV